MYPDQPIVGIGVVIVSKGKIVMAKRGNEPGKGKWTIPGGIVELGENIKITVIREAKEETCLDVADPQLIDVVDSVTYDEEKKIKYHYVIADFFVKVKGGELKAESDVLELRWVPFNELDQLITTISFKDFMRDNRAKLEQLDSYS
jgi:ADP-ribose pyrophosphatase YjhB (NUDIX family)